MKRNSKFLLLLALIMSGILGVYFIGCEGDTITNEAEQPPDRVIGSVHGVVSNDFDNTPLANVQVTWVSNEDTHTVVTGTNGYYVTDDVLVTGEYEFTFSVSGFAVVRAFVTIPSVEDLRGQPGSPVSGDIRYSETLDKDLFPMNAGVTGKVYTALPAPGKEIELPIAADDSSILVSPVAGKVVQLEYGADIVPHVYVDTTDQNGVYFFGDVPCVTGYDYVWIRVLPFTEGDSSYREVTDYVEPVCGDTITQPNIYAPLDCDDIPQVLRTNFPEMVRFHYDSSLFITFSESMDTLGFTIDIYPSTTFDSIWSIDDQILEINPQLPLLTDTDYELTLSGKSRDGCPTSGRTWYFDFTTLDGIRLASTNVERAPGDFTEFPIDSPIVLNFNMLPVINPLNGELRLDDWTDYPSIFRVDIDSQVVNSQLNQIIVTPDNPLERDHEYRLTYTIHSQIVGDYVSGYLRFWTEFDTIPPAMVTGFAVDTTAMGSDWPADWNTTEIDFKWNTVGNATGYRIYAKDNKSNTDFIVVGDFDQKDYQTYQTGVVDLPAQFDLYDDDVVQSPFSGGTIIEFDIRAYNRAGQGPFTGSPKSVDDDTPPEFDLYVCGSADNFLGLSDSVLTIDVDGNFYNDGTSGGDMLEYCQVSANPTFVFAEAGGDAAYVLPAGAGSWTWDANMRDGSGTITVPAGMVGAGDNFTLQILDNSGNLGQMTIRLRPTIDFVTPNSSDTTFEAMYGMIDWDITTGCGVSSISCIDIYISWDNGATWIDTLPCRDDSPELYPVPDTLIVVDTALIGIENAAGGFRWLSEPFTVNGIKITMPDSAYFAAADTVFDAGNTDSTLVPMAWNSTSLISDVVIWYSIDGFNNDSSVVDTIPNTGTYDFYAPSRGDDYYCWLRVADADYDGRPMNSTSDSFHVFHDTVIFFAPQLEDVVDGGSVVYNIRWYSRYDGVDSIFDTLPSVLDIDYAVDAQTDTNWIELRDADGTENDGFHTWDTVPYTTPTNYALVRILTQDSTEYVSDSFTISGLIITEPVGGEDWDVGSSQTIKWTNYGGFTGNIDIDYSTDGGSNWVGIDSNIANPGQNGNYAWTIPNVPSAQVLVRVTEGAAPNLIQDVSDSNFTIAGIIVTDPNGGETWLVGRSDTVKWSVIGNIGDSIGIKYSIDNGTTFDSTLTPNPIANSGLFGFLVPTFAGLPYNQCLVRVYDWNGTAVDTSDAVFTIDQPLITITAPVSTDTLQMGNSFTITWDTLGLRATSLELRLSTDGGTTFPMVIDTVSATATSYLWSPIPNLGGSPLPNSMIRIEELDTPNPLNDESDVFLIIP